MKKNYIVNVIASINNGPATNISLIAKATGDIDAINMVTAECLDLGIVIIKYVSVINTTPTDDAEEPTKPVRRKKKARGKRGAYKSRKPAKSPAASDASRIKIGDVAAYVKKKHGVTIKPSLGNYWTRHGSYGTKLKTVAGSKPMATTAAYIDAFMAIRAKKIKK